jgi:nicotinamidase-related amidase
MTNPKLEVLTPQNSQLIFIDHQPQMAFGVQSIDRRTLKNNVVALAKAAKVFKIPTIITAVESQSFSGYTYPELLDVFPNMALLERTSMNSWDDKKVRDALKANGRKKVVVSGLWVEVCNNTFALTAMLEDGYEIYMVADASGGTSKEAHEYSMQRMIQVGVVPMTWQQVMLEWQRDWGRSETYDAVILASPLVAPSPRRHQTPMISRTIPLAMKSHTAAAIQMKPRGTAIRNSSPSAWANLNVPVVYMARGKATAQNCGS